MEICSDVITVGYQQVDKQTDGRTSIYICIQHANVISVFLPGELIMFLGFFFWFWRSFWYSVIRSYLSCSTIQIHAVYFVCVLFPLFTFSSSFPLFLSFGFSVRVLLCVSSLKWSSFWTRYCSCKPIYADYHALWNKKKYFFCLLHIKAYPITRLIVISSQQYLLFAAEKEAF